MLVPKFSLMALGNARQADCSDKRTVRLPNNRKCHPLPIGERVLMLGNPFLSHPVLVRVWDIECSIGDGSVSSKTLNFRCVVKSKGAERQSLSFKCRDLFHFLSGKQSLLANIESYTDTSLLDVQRQGCALTHLRGTPNRIVACLEVVSDYIDLTGDRTVPTVIPCSL